MSDEREAYGTGKHPPYCTCVDCTARRRGVPPPPRRDYYEILGVRRDATAGEIQEAYHKKKFDYVRTEAKAKEINQAYDVLRDRVRRPRHDRSHYYTVLGVAPNATEQQIRYAFREKASKYHPDRAAVVLKECEEAYATLRDPAKRTRYDRSRQPQRPPPRAEPSKRPTEAPPRPPKQPPREPTEAPPRPLADPPGPPKSGCGPRAAIALLVLVAAIGAMAYFGGFLDSNDAPPPAVIVMTPTLAPIPTPVIAPATPTPTPTPAPTALPTPTATPAEPTPTPTVSPLEIWEAAEKAVHEALAAYDSAEGDERTAALAVYEDAQAAEAHAFAVWQGLPTPPPRPPTATPPPTSTPIPQPTSTPTPRPTATPTPRPTATPTPRPTSTPTPRPTATPAYAVAWANLPNVPWLEQNRPALATAIKSLPWVVDGIAEAEREAVLDLVQLATFYEPVFSGLIRKPWAKDGLGDSEATVVQNLRGIAGQDEAVALRLVAMPFLNEVQPSDGVAVRSLRLLAHFNARDFQRVMSHPTLRNGISDDWAKVVALLSGVSRTNPQLIDVLLDPNRVTLEERSITLPQAGSVDLAIIRTGPESARSMDLLEHAVRHAEAFMAEPFPTGYVVLLFENAVAGSSVGTNFGTHMAVRPEYDVDDGSREAESVPHTIAHEVAHYYWSGNRDWVDEGAADFMASIAESARTGQRAETNNPPCGYARSISDLEGLNSPRGSDAFDCNYALGERLFADLYRGLGDVRFREGFLNLYLLSQVEDDDDAQTGTTVGIDDLKEAFRTGADRAATLVDVIVARWYDGTEPYDASARDTGPVDPNLPRINGRIDQAFISTTPNGPPVSRVSAASVPDWIWLNLKHSYSVSGGPHTTSLEIVEYFEDGFEFRRRGLTLTAEERYIGGTRLLSVGAQPTERRAVGRYWVYVYHEDGRKVAEVQYEVIP